MGDENGRRITSGSRRWLSGEAVAMLLILLLAVLIRIPSFWEPIGSDQAISALFANALRQGQVFYRDVWDHHTPLEFYIHAAAQLLFGSTTRTVALLDLLWRLANGLALYALARRLHGRATALLGTGLYLLFSNSVAFNLDTVGTWTVRIKPEVFMILPSVVGLYAMLQAVEQGQRRPSFCWGLAGLAWGFATALKPVGALFLIGAWIALLISALRTPSPKLAIVIRHTIWLAGGSVLAQLVYLVPTAWQGTLRDFWQAVVQYNFGPYGQLGLSRSRFLAVSVLIGKETFGLWLLAAAGFLLMLLRDRKWGNWLLIAWGLLSGMVLILQNRYYSYQYLPLLPPLCMLAAYGAVRFWRLAGDVRWRPMAWGLRLLLAFLVLANIAQFARTNRPYYNRYVSLISRDMDRGEFYEAFSTYPRHYSYPADQAVADWVRERTEPDEPLATLGGYGATAVFLAGRPPASRYVFTYHLFHTRTADDSMVQAMRAQLLADLQASQPPYVLLYRPLEEFERFGPLYEWLVTNYELEREFEHERFLFRRSG